MHFSTQALIDLARLVGWGWLGCALCMALLWWRQTSTRNATSVDVAWAALLGLLGIFYALAADGWWPRRLALALLAGLWSARLSWHLYRDRLRKHAGREDGRYAELRTRWSQAGFFAFYQAQAAFDALLSLPFALIALEPRVGFSALELAALVVWALAVGGESLADRQLARFKARPDARGRTCRAGLWSWSRHPNYFFEWLHWTSYALLAWNCANGALGLSSAILILYLVLCVTGIPPTEAQSLRSRGEDYREYQRTTSAFWPWPGRAPWLLRWPGGS